MRFKSARTSSGAARLTERRRKPHWRTATKKYNSVITTAAVFLCWDDVIVTALAQHEDHCGQKPPAQDNRPQPEMWRRGGQVEMYMLALNNLLAMSYLLQQRVSLIEYTICCAVSRHRMSRRPTIG